jgi:cytochrome b
VSPVPEKTTRRAVLVWDLPTRLFHWLVVLLVIAAYVTQRLDWMTGHVLAGTAVLALVLFRLAWGVVGSETARFARFLASPHAALHHLAQMLRREPDTQIGHNPAGGWMVLLLLVLLLGETLSGILTNNDVADEGPLTEVLPNWALNGVSDLHTWLWWALLVAVTLHVAAVLTYAVAKGQDLVRPMLTGRKFLAASAPRTAPMLRAVLLLVIAAAVAEFAVDWL